MPATSTILLLISGRSFNAAVDELLIRAPALLERVRQLPDDAGYVTMMPSFYGIHDKPWWTW